MKTKTKKIRWVFERRIWRFYMYVCPHINSQCVCLGITINWNYRPSVEVDFMFWRLHVEYTAPKPTAHR